jgi:uncharacterized protein (DUF2336 family)
MIVRQFLLWARAAPPDQRAEAVSGLAQAYLDGELSPDDRRDAGTALTAMLDDPSPMVRQAMAETFADSSEAPRHVIIALAADQKTQVASVVLARSPVLVDADLIDCAALGDELVQAAIARRPYVSVATSAALAEIAAPVALATLATNAGAEIADVSLWRMVERHGSDPVLRTALLRRPGLPLDIRHAVALAESGRLSAFVTENGWLAAGRAERAFGDARDRATVALAMSATASDVQRLAAYLRRSGQLTAALILRALLSRSTAFVEAAFADLARLPPARVAGLLHDRRGAGFPALYDRAGLPKSLKPAFQAALFALQETRASEPGLRPAQLSGLMIERVLSVCAGLPSNVNGKLMALLRRYEVEAAREAARQAAGVLAEDAAAALALEYQPTKLIEARPEALRSAA